MSPGRSVQGLHDIRGPRIFDNCVNPVLTDTGSRSLLWNRCFHADLFKLPEGRVIDLPHWLPCVRA